MLAFLRPQRISTKLIVGLLAFSSVVTLGITAVQLTIEYRSDVRAITSSLDSIESTHLTPITHAVWVGDREMTGVLLEGIVSQRDIEFAIVVEGAETLGRAGSQPEEGGPSRSFPLRYEYKGEFRDLGELFVQAGMEGVHDRLQQRVVVILLSQGVKTFLTTGFLFFLFYYLLGRHITGLARQTSSATPGKLLEVQLDRRPSPGNRLDELDALVDSLNAMSRAAYFAYREMEQRVEERTSELIEANQELEASREQFRRLVENSPDIVYSFAVNTGATYISSRAEQVLGYPAKTFEENPLLWYESIHPDDKERVDGAIETATSGSPFSLEYRIRDSRGRWRWFYDRSMGVRGEGDEAVIEGLAMDVTERKELEQLRDDVERVMQHDLKAPISSALALLTMIEADDLTGEQRKILAASMKGDLENMLLSINTTLNVYRMEAGEYEFDAEKLDLVRAVEAVAAKLAHLAQHRGVSLQVDAGAGELPILGEERLVESILLNLVTNAIEASPKGGAVTVSLGCENSLCIVRIRNTGAVPETIRNTFFEKYVTAEKRHGTGLGTYSARIMAQAMGGDVAMETSDERDETVVTVQLPAA